MTKSEIQKALYKQDPTAHFLFIRMGVAYYTTVLEGAITLHFHVPVEDMGTADFNVEMPAKYMVRWALIPDA